MAFMKHARLWTAFVLIASVASESEYICSKFPYEEQLLEKMIRMEIKVEDMVKQIKGTEENVMAILNDMETKMEVFADDYKNLEENVTKSFLGAKADVDLFTKSLKNEVIRLKDSLKTEIDLKKAEIDRFRENATDGLQVFKEGLEAQIDQKKVEIDQYKQDATSNLDGFMKNITTDVQKEIAELDLLEVKLGNPMVAFNAHNPSDLSIGTDENFQYADVLLNKGGGYNISTGTFTAPITGLYYFSAHVCALAAKFVHYGIVVGGNVRAASSQREDTDSSCGSVSVVASVSGGQEVYVKCLSGNAYEPQITESSTRWNSFVGALIQ